VVAISGHHFRAADAGQMSLFGAASGVVDEIHLPEVKNVDKREMLNWERELIGLYITDHPLNEYQAILTKIVSYFSGQLGEANHEEKVRVAGMVTVVKPYSTKAGKPMGFVTIEDIQGTIELVLFTRTWERYKEQLKDGQVIIVEGKVDTTNTPPKVLADIIRTEINVTTSVDSLPEEPMMPPAPVKPLQYQSKVVPARKENPPAKPNQPAPAGGPSAPIPVVAESASKYAPLTSPQIPPEFGGNEGGDVPPPPDNFPDDWDAEWQPSFDEALIAAKPAPKFEKDELITPPQAVLADSMLTEKIDEVTGETIVTSYTVPSLYVPLAKPGEEHPPRQITIILRASQDKARDKRRIQTLYGLLHSAHGKDKFSFQIFESGKGHLIDFPNETTNISKELLARLYKVLGEECWRVEEITFQ
jgi:DNA polymerase-3 subunit alpha